MMINKWMFNRSCISTNTFCLAFAMAICTPLTANGFDENTTVVYVNGEVITMTSAQPGAVATIAAAGKGARTVDLDGSAILPGFIDAHGHFSLTAMYEAFANFAASDKPVGPQTYSDEDVLTVVVQARKHGLKVATHAHGAEGIMASVKAGAASIEDGSILTEKIVKEMKARGTFLVPTTPVMNQSALKDPNLPSKGVEVIEKAIQNHRLAIKSGVKIAYGTDAGLYSHGKNADGFLDLIDYGMSPAQAIKTATVNAAELLGVDDRGVIAVGKLAYIIAVDGNQLEDVSLLKDVSFVMKNGKIYKLAAQH